jgi:acetoin utilization deacetylase AcuC-like enzyme
MPSALIYTDAYVNYQYSDSHPLKPYRLQLTHTLMQSYGLLQLPQSRVVETLPAEREEFELFHTPEYVRVLAAADAGKGLCRAEAERAARNPAPTQSRQRAGGIPPLRGLSLGFSARAWPPEHASRRCADAAQAVP